MSTLITWLTDPQSYYKTGINRIKNLICLYLFPEASSEDYDNLLEGKTTENIDEDLDNLEGTVKANFVNDLNRIEDESDSFTKTVLYVIEWYKTKLDSLVGEVHPISYNVLNVFNYKKLLNNLLLRKFNVSDALEKNKIYQLVDNLGATATDTEISNIDNFFLTQDADKYLPLGEDGRYTIKYSTKGYSVSSYTIKGNLPLNIYVPAYWQNVGGPMYSSPYGINKIKIYPYNNTYSFTFGCTHINSFFYIKPSEEVITAITTMDQLNNFYADLGLYNATASEKDFVEHNTYTFKKTTNDNEIKYKYVPIDYSVKYDNDEAKLEALKQELEAGIIVFGRLCWIKNTSDSKIEFSTAERRIVWDSTSLGSISSTIYGDGSSIQSPVNLTQEIDGSTILSHLSDGANTQYNQNQNDSQYDYTAAYTDSYNEIEFGIALGEAYNGRANFTAEKRPIYIKDSFKIYVDTLPSKVYEINTSANCPLGTQILYKKALVDTEQYLNNNSSYITGQDNVSHYSYHSYLYTQTFSDAYVPVNVDKQNDEEASFTYTLKNIIDRLDLAAGFKNNSMKSVFDSLSKKDINTLLSSIIGSGSNIVISKGVSLSNNTIFNVTNKEVIGLENADTSVLVNRFGNNTYKDNTLVISPQITTIVDNNTGFGALIKLVKMKDHNYCRTVGTGTLFINYFTCNTSTAVISRIESNDEEDFSQVETSALCYFEDNSSTLVIEYFSTRGLLLIPREYKSGTFTYNGTDNCYWKYDLNYTEEKIRNGKRTLYTSVNGSDQIYTENDQEKIEVFSYIDLRLASYDTAKICVIEDTDTNRDAYKNKILVALRTICNSMSVFRGFYKIFFGNTSLNEYGYTNEDKYWFASTLENGTIPSQKTIDYVQPVGWPYSIILYPGSTVSGSPSQLQYFNYAKCIILPNSIPFPSLAMYNSYECIIHEDDFQGGWPLVGNSQVHIRRHFKYGNSIDDTDSNYIGKKYTGDDYEGENNTSGTSGRHTYTVTYFCPAGETINIFNHFLYFRRNNDVTSLNSISYVNIQDDQQGNISNNLTWRTISQTSSSDHEYAVTYTNNTSNDETFTLTFTARTILSFAGCENITEVDLENSGLVNLGTTNFAGCIGLTKITLPSTLKTIGMGSFIKCINLTSITIPGSVESIEDCAFDGCDKLEIITFDSGSDNALSLGGTQNCRNLYSSLTSNTYRTLLSSLKELKTIKVYRGTGNNRLVDAIYQPTWDTLNFLDEDYKIGIQYVTYVGVNMDPKLKDVYINNDFTFDAVPVSYSNDIEYHLECNNIDDNGTSIQDTTFYFDILRLCNGRGNSNTKFWTDALDGKISCVTTNSNNQPTTKNYIIDSNKNLRSDITDENKDNYIYAVNGDLTIDSNSNRRIFFSNNGNTVTFSKGNSNSTEKYIIYNYAFGGKQFTHLELDDAYIYGNYINAFANTPLNEITITTPPPYSGFPYLADVSVTQFNINGGTNSINVGSGSYLKVSDACLLYRPDNQGNEYYMVYNNESTCDLPTIESDIDGKITKIRNYSIGQNVIKFITTPNLVNNEEVSNSPYYISVLINCFNSESAEMVWLDNYKNDVLLNTPVPRTTYCTFLNPPKIGTTSTVATITDQMYKVYIPYGMLSTYIANDFWKQYIQIYDSLVLKNYKYSGINYTLNLKSNATVPQWQSVLNDLKQADYYVDLLNDYEDGEIPLIYSLDYNDFEYVVDTENTLESQYDSYTIYKYIGSIEISNDSISIIIQAAINDDILNKITVDNSALTTVQSLLSQSQFEDYELVGNTIEEKQ